MVGRADQKELETPRSCLGFGREEHWGNLLGPAHQRGGLQRTASAISFGERDLEGTPGRPDENVQRRSLTASDGSAPPPLYL